MARNATNIATKTGRAHSTTQRPLLMLRLLYSGESGMTVQPGELLSPGRLPIGRAVQRGISLPADERASRHHATIEVSEDEAVVRAHDNGSKNGTFVNGSRITVTELRDGDLVRTGDSFFLFRHEPVASAVDTPIDGVLGISPVLRSLRRELRLLAGSCATVLLQGETGTGKEVFAQALHRLSERAQQPLVVLDGGAIPRNLIESELFGHEAGAFTGAQRARPGLFEQAHGGTLFIDELGELPLPLQPMLLRAVEQGVIRRVGGNAPIKVDVRLIAATNRDLLREVDKGTFRADLYARLAEICLRLPPLRERREDVLVLLMHALGQPAPRLSPELVEALLLYPFPFNVREVVKLAAELRMRGQGKAMLELELVAHRLTAPRLPTTPPPPEPVRGRGQPTREELAASLDTAGGVISEVARQFGCSRKQIYRWLEQYGMSLDSYRDS